MFPVYHPVDQAINLGVALKFSVSLISPIHSLIKSHPCYILNVSHIHTHLASMITYIQSCNNPLASLLQYQSPWSFPSLPPKLSSHSLRTIWLFCNPMNYSLPGSSVQEFPRKEYKSGCHSLSHVIFPTQGSNLGLLHCRQILYHLSHQVSVPYFWLFLLAYRQNLNSTLKY